MNQSAPVLLIGLDAAELTLVERLCDEGRLPALQALRAQGSFGALAGDATTFAGGVWPSFYTARPVPYHGIYHNKLWRPANMRCEIAAPDWLPEQPFWAQLGPDRRVAILDMPMTVAPPRVARGVQVAGWGTHDLIASGAWPAGLWRRLVGEVGRPLMPVELFGPQTPATLRRLRAELLAATEQMARLSAGLLRQERWDLFAVVFGATHRAGHYLWDLSQIDAAALAPTERRELEGALVEIYQACDRAVARLVEQAPGYRVMVFAVHGMGPNASWADRCADLLGLIQRRGAAAPPRAGLLYRVKKALPWELVREVTTRLPTAVTNRLVELWSARMFDWGSTRSFPLPMDHAGYVRINLRGREPQGIVAPGAEYDALCAELSAAFCSFRDIESGRPIVERVYRLDELAPPDAPYRTGLPDLLIVWADVPVSGSRGVRSPDYGELRLDPPGRLPSGRAGNHRPHGWCIAAGPGIAAGGRIQGQSILDLAPTALHWLGAPVPQLMQGRPIETLEPIPFQ